MTYPIMLHIAGRVCVIVGGGVVAARKVDGLLAAGGSITVISPTLHPILAQYAAEGSIAAWIDVYRAGMFTALNPFLVFAATNNPAVNQQVLADARALGILADSVEAHAQRDFSSMAALRRGAITIGISSDGASPALTAHLRAKLEALIGEEYAVFVEWLRDLRPQVEAHIADQTARAALWRALVDSDALDLLRAGDAAGARAVMAQITTSFGVVEYD